jgi:hypothetical protein
MRSHALLTLRPLRSLRSLRPSASLTATTRPVSTWKPRQRVPIHNTGTKPPPPPSEAVFDPQPAIPPAAIVTDLDPALSQQPIPSAPPTSSGAFTAALVDSEVSLSGSGSDTGATVDWSSSFHGLSTTAFPPETAAVLMRELDPRDVEIKPDGIVYLPEIKYRRILNLAFGPGGWGMAPRGETVVGDKVVTREYALIVHGR